MCPWFEELKEISRDTLEHLVHGTEIAGVLWPFLCSTCASAWLVIHLHHQQSCAGECKLSKCLHPEGP